MRVAIYARVSTERQEQEETIESQLQQIREYAAKNSFVVVNEYKDDGYSGELLNRPALDRLRDDASKKFFDAVLITCPDRLARKYAHQAIILEEFEQEGIKVIFLNRPIAETPEDKMLLGMQGLFAEYEKEKIKERTRRGKLHKAKEGFLVGSLAPYGYDYVRRTKEREGYYTVDEDESKVVRMIFNLFVEEKSSIRGLVRRLTSMGIKPPRTKRAWAKSTISRILRNETYIGVTHYNKHYSVSSSKQEKEKYRKTTRTGMRLRPREEWIPIKVPSIIETEIFERAKKQLEENARFSARNVKHKYLLRGLIRCGNCGSLFMGVPCHGETFYRCSNRQKNFPFPKTCDAKMVKTAKIDAFVWQTISEFLDNPELILEEIRRSEHEKNEENLLSELSRVERDIERIENRKRKIIRAYSEDDLSMEEFKMAMKEIRSEEARISKEKEFVKSEIENVKDKILKVENLKKICSIISESARNISFEEKQKILRFLVEQITIKNGDLRIKCIVPLEKQANQAFFQESCQFAFQPC